MSAVLVIASTNLAELNRRIYEDCQGWRILCNVADQPEDYCDFFVPAVVKRGDLQIAIGTEGHCPAYAGHTPAAKTGGKSLSHGQFVEELAKVRTPHHRDNSRQRSTQVLLGKLASDDSFQYFTEHGPTQWHHHAEELIQQCRMSNGTGKIRKGEIINLYLIQHAAAFPKEQYADQPLTEEGYWQAQQASRVCQTASSFRQCCLAQRQNKSVSNSQTFLCCFGGARPLLLHEGLSPNDAPEPIAEEIKKQDKT